MCTSCAPCRCKTMCKLHLVCSHVGAKKMCNLHLVCTTFCTIQGAKTRCKLHLGWCKKRCKLHLGWWKKWCKRGAICACFCTYMVQKVVQTRCNLHMFLHLDGAKNGAHEFQILVLSTNDVNTYTCISECKDKRWCHLWFQATFCE